VQEYAVEVAHLGFAPIVPQLLPGMSHRQCMVLDHALVSSASLIAVHASRWVADSSGVAREISWARSEGIAVAFSIEEVREVARALRAATAA
jgi:hypothetical protein